MEVYVLKNGERRGPFSAWRLREMLEEGEFSTTDQGWHTGMEAWQPLTQIPALEMWMPRDPALPPPLPEPAEMAKKAGRTLAEVEEMKERDSRRAHAWLRLMARTLDNILFYLLFWIAGVSAGYLSVWDYGDFRGMHPLWPLLWIVPAVLQVPVEAALLRWTGTTPGKWMAGIRVHDDLGQNPSWGAAFKRSALVLVAGAGLGLPLAIASPICLLPVVQGIAGLVQYRSRGFTLWDRTAGTEVHHRAITPVGFTSILVILGSSAAIYMYLFIAVPLPARMPEEVRRQIEESRHTFKTRVSLPAPAPQPTAVPVPAA